MCVCGRERPLRLFEVLARNRQSALGPYGGIFCARIQPTRVFTIPPRQQLSITIVLAIRRRSVTQVVGYTKRKREITRERYNKREREILLPKKQERSCEKRDTPPLNFHLRKRLKKSKTDLLSNARESLVFSTRDERYSLSWSRLTDSERVLTRS